MPVMDKYKSDDSGPGDDLWWRSVAKLAHPIAEGKKKVTAGRKLADISRPVGCAGGRGRQALTQATESPALTLEAFAPLGHMFKNVNRRRACMPAQKSMGYFPV